MKLRHLLMILITATACTTFPPESKNVAPEEETYFTVEPTSKTKVTTFHVQTERLPAPLQAEFNQALANLDGKCWIWAVLSSKHTAGKDLQSCVQFKPYGKIDALKPSKREPTDKKMLFTLLDSAGKLQIQNFVWDGKKLQRIRNSDTTLSMADDQSDRFEKLMIIWALK